MNTSESKIKKFRRVNERKRVGAETAEQALQGCRESRTTTVPLYVKGCHNLTVDTFQGDIDLTVFSAWK
jgi:hypothetical protein